MDRGPSSHLLSWLLLPVCAVLALSALGIARQPYTGLLLRDDWVAAVEPGSPAARAGVARGDRLISSEPLPSNPIAPARPGEPLPLLRERGDSIQGVVIVPEPLPARERRMMAALLAVACGFVVLGGWVWSERRDRLARIFFLLCLAFAMLLVPFPRGGGVVARIAWDTFYSAVSVFLPALFVHFFALFPETTGGAGPGARGAGSRVRASIPRIAYAVSSVLFLAALALLLLPFTTRVSPTAALAVLDTVAAVWFALAVATALVLFARSYLRARAHPEQPGPDARRRLRVALAGTVLGVAPLATLVVLHNLFPGLRVPGERWAVIATLLVPASFAWAAAVHRVFEVRVALRVAAVAAVLALAAALVYAAGEWLAAAWRPDLGAGIAGGALAFCALAASAAGPATGWLRTLSARLVPDGGDLPPAEWLERHAAAGRASGTRVLDSACETLVACLKLDGCVALVLGPNGTRPAFTLGLTRVPALAPEAFARLAQVKAVVAVSDPRLARADREALAAAGASWVLPLPETVPRTVLLLGRRLAGPWLGPRETRDLERFAARLDLLLENAALREQASAHGALDRELSRAGVIQAHLRPRRIPADRALDCAAAALSCEPVGGDYYDFVRGPDHGFTLAVGDAAGKGIPAALMGAWAQACFRQQARQGATPGAVLAALNRELVAMDQPEAFVALLCARVDPRAGRLVLANAGLPPPLLRRRDGRFETLEHTGLLLGVLPHGAYEDLAVELDPGDVLALYTDGLSEAQRGDEMFGTRRLREVLEANAARGAAEILRALLAAAQEFTDQPLDDITILVLKQIAAPKRAAVRPAPRAAAEIGVEIALKSVVQPADTTN